RSNATSDATSPSATPSVTSTAPSGAGADPQLELELFAVLLVPVATDLLKAEPPDESKGRLVSGADRSDEAMDSVLAGSPIEQRSDDFGGVTPSPVRLEDHVSNLDRVRGLDGVDTGRAMKTGVADHWPLAL